MNTILQVVINKSTQEEVYNEHCGYLIINDINDFQIEKPLKIQLVNGSQFTDEIILDLAEDDYGYWIETTENRWRFDYVYEED